MTMMEDYHNEEELAKERIQRRVPNHPILKKYFGSTYKAVEAYWEVEKELDSLSPEGQNKEVKK